MKPNPTRQRRQAHKLRLQFPRALHRARAASRNFQRALRIGVRPHVAVSKSLRGHRTLLMRALFRA